MQISAGYAKGMKLVAPKGDKTRPTGAKVRAAVFNMLQAQLDGATVLDLFAGSGAMGIEAASRGAGRVVFVENAPAAAGALKQNLAELDRRALAQGMEPTDVRLVARDAGVAIASLAGQGPFDVIYVDPPYALARAWLVEHGVGLGALAAAGGVLIAEIANAPEGAPPPPADTWEFVKDRVYGDTMIVVWRKV
jgi:16S rRNA (guanine966-N2)-methyltransferase